MGDISHAEQIIHNEILSGPEFLFTIEDVCTARGWRTNGTMSDIVLAGKTIEWCV